MDYIVYKITKHGSAGYPVESFKKALDKARDMVLSGAERAEVWKGNGAKGAKYQETRLVYIEKGEKKDKENA